MDTKKMNTIYHLSVFNHAIKKNNEIIVCHSGNGNSLKMPSDCWENIEKYITYYSPSEICNAAHEDDKLYYQEIFSKMADIGLIIKDTYEERIKSVDLAITNRCNLHCAHCCEAAQNEGVNHGLSTQEWKDIIDKICFSDVETITITGGEPMLRRDFFDIAEYLKKVYKGAIGLSSNGTFITKDNVKRIRDTFSDISISIDGYDEDTCSRLRGSGVFKKVVEAVGLLIENGFDSKRISLSMVETAITFGKRELFEKLCSDLNVRSVVREFSKVGRGAENADWLCIGQENKPKHRMEGYNNLKREMALARPSCDCCSAGRTRISINHIGDIYPCLPLENKRFCFGNMRDVENLRNYFDNACNNSRGYYNFQSILANKRERCSQCNVAPFCVGCLESFEREIEEFGIDAICKENKEYLQEAIWGK